MRPPARLLLGLLLVFAQLLAGHQDGRDLLLGRLLATEEHVGDCHGDARRTAVAPLTARGAAPPVTGRSTRRARVHLLQRLTFAARCGLPAAFSLGSRR